jgi:hypothetical protein
MVGLLANRLDLVCAKVVHRRRPTALFVVEREEERLKVLSVVLLQCAGARGKEREKRRWSKGNGVSFNTHSQE